MALAGTGLFKQTDNTPLEKFSFSFERNCNCDLGYTILLGKQKYCSALSDWSTNLETIRHDLESFVFHKETTLELFFEDSPTIITLKKESLLNPQTEKEKGSGFAWEEVLYVHIKPNSFQSKTDREISGYCELKSGIESIYTAFLQCALLYKGPKTDTNTHLWPNRKDFYNIIKSPIIEDFIADRNYDPYAPKRRYAPIDIVISIYPDFYSSTCNDFSGVYDDIFEDVFTVFDNDDNIIQEITVPGIENWLNEFRDATDFAETTTSPNFDFKEWHQRGIKFAQKIRNKLIDNCDLWYCAPYEDKSGTIKEKILIL